MANQTQDLGFRVIVPESDQKSLRELYRRNKAILNYLHGHGRLNSEYHFGHYDRIKFFLMDVVREEAGAREAEKSYELSAGEEKNLAQLLKLSDDMVP